MPDFPTGLDRLLGKVFRGHSNSRTLALVFTLAAGVALPTQSQASQQQGTSLKQGPQTQLSLNPATRDGESESEWTHERTVHEIKLPGLQQSRRLMRLAIENPFGDVRIRRRAFPLSNSIEVIANVQQQVTVPQVAVPQVAAPQVDLPQSTVLQSTVPQTTVSQVRLTHSSPIPQFRLVSGITSDAPQPATKGNGYTTLHIKPEFSRPEFQRGLPQQEGAAARSAPERPRQRVDLTIIVPDTSPAGHSFKGLSLQARTSSGLLQVGGHWHHVDAETSEGLLEIAKADTVKTFTKSGEQRITLTPAPQPASSTTSSTTGSKARSTARSTDGAIHVWAPTTRAFNLDSPDPTPKSASKHPAKKIQATQITQTIDVHTDGPITFHETAASPSHQENQHP